MPSGRTHDRITLWCLPFVTGFTAWLTYSPPLTVITGLAFVISGFMLGPDLDIRSLQYRRWGPLRWIWLPYQNALPHRSKYSHGPIIGTALRVIYLSGWLALLTLLITLVMNAMWDAQLTWEEVRPMLNHLLKRYLKECLAVLVGLELGAMSHSLSDVLGSSMTRQRARRKKALRKKNNRKK